MRPVNTFFPKFRSGIKNKWSLKKEKYKRHLSPANFNLKSNKYQESKAYDINFPHISEIHQAEHHFYFPTGRLNLHHNSLVPFLHSLVAYALNQRADGGRFEVHTMTGTIMVIKLIYIALYSTINGRLKVLYKKISRIWSQKWRVHCDPC